MPIRLAAARAGSLPIELGHVEDLSHDGRGIVRQHGKIVFIEGALPTEDVEFQIIRRRHEYDEARVLAVKTRSMQRVSPVCQHFGICGGCVLQHLAPAAQLAAKQKILFDNLERIGHLKPQAILPPVSGPAWGYRRRARLSVRCEGSRDLVRVGFIEKNSKRITDVQRCETLHPSIGSLIGPLSALIGKLSILERIPQIEVAVGAESSVLVLRVLSQPDIADRKKLHEFEQAHYVRFYLQPGTEDTAVPLSGERVRLGYSLPDWNVHINFEPADFIQVNSEINQQLVAHAIDELRIDSQHRVLDLFSGLGNFTLPIARIAKEVVGIEGESSLVNRARVNAQCNRLSNVKYYQADLFTDQSHAVWMRQTYDRLLLDPPRTGAREILRYMDDRLPPRIVYISCHPATLARDANYLVHERKYQLLTAGVVDMFPHTAHVESIAVFACSGSQR